MALCTLQSATPAHRTRWVKIENFDHERVFRFRPLLQWSISRIFTHFGRPTAENYGSVFLTVVRPIGTFDRHGVRPKHWFSPFEVRQWVKFSGGYGGERYSHARAEGKHHPGGYDPLDRVGQAEPSNHEDGSGAVYTPSTVQSPLLPPKGGADKALYGPKVFGVVV